MLAAAQAIRDAGIMQYPIVMNMKTGWNVGESFNLVFLAHGGEFFKPGSAEPSVNSAAGVAALETLKSLVEYAHPDHLTQASNETQALWEAGEAALGIMWGSRGAPILVGEVAFQLLAAGEEQTAREKESSGEQQEKSAQAATAPISDHAAPPYPRSRGWLEIQYSSGVMPRSHICFR